MITDFLIVGGGIAGLRAAIGLASAGRVTILTKAEPTESNTGYAQGGIAAAVGEDDNAALHAADTINAGDGKYKLSGENGEDFPKIPVVENASSVNLAASVLAEAINKTIFAVSNDELRPAMTGVYCQLSSQAWVITGNVAPISHRRPPGPGGRRLSRSRCRSVSDRE